MRGDFSIEWMAQSSQPAGHLAPGIPTCATDSESLPGFYCQQRSEHSPQQEQQEQQEHQEQQQESPRGLQHRTCAGDPATEADFSSETEEETSGYESEGDRSPSAAATRGSTAPLSPLVGRRPRTAFTAEQISSLERAFKKNAYLGTQDKAELCKKLDLSDKQIRNWFQNRRMKLKRSVQDALAHACQANVASQLMHYSELQAYRPGPYPMYHSAVDPEGPAPTSYVSPHRLPYSSSAPLNSFYQYGSHPGVVLPSISSHLQASYPTYAQYY
ncbi:ventrally expressed dharma/bozozok antagonist [Brachyistius frenatus]|uniref:ventrally expressed dharma/bozozok antagonist n=1 Tax=Brachyistius frenatus TaxID=100188 RepID=UPI0037E75BB9